MKHHLLRRSKFSVWRGWLVAGLTAVTLSMPQPVQADVPSLQVAPLEYKSALTPGHVSTGFIDVANPADSTVTIASGVRGFRQTGTQGDLEFFDDADLAAAIHVELPQFDLGAREAVRVVFSVDAAKLPAGGTYAAIFFQTTPPAQSSVTSYVAQSANVGTLLELENGASTTKHGRIASWQLPFLQLGDRISGQLTYQNTDHTSAPVGFRPELTVHIAPWGRHGNVPTGLVLPKMSRIFNVSHTGSYVGILPITLSDAATGTSATRWIVACTGWYRPILPVLFVLCIAYFLVRRRRSIGQPGDDDNSAERLL